MYTEAAAAKGTAYMVGGPPAHSWADAALLRAGEMPAGEMPAGAMPAGAMPAGEMPPGEMPGPERLDLGRLAGVAAAAQPCYTYRHRPSPGLAPQGTWGPGKGLTNARCDNFTKLMGDINKDASDC